MVEGLVLVFLCLLMVRKGRRDGGRLGVGWVEEFVGDFGYVLL